MNGTNGIHEARVTSYDSVDATAIFVSPVRQLSPALASSPESDTRRFSRVRRHPSPNSWRTHRRQGQTHFRRLFEEAGTDTFGDSPTARHAPPDRQRATRNTASDGRPPPPPGPRGFSGLGRRPRRARARCSPEEHGHRKTCHGARSSGQRRRGDRSGARARKCMTRKVARPST